MQARIFSHDGDDASNGGGETYKLCVNGKVHLTYLTSWYDQTGCEEDANDSFRYYELEPCNGSCSQQLDLPPEVEALIQKFLVSGGKDRGEFGKTTPRYPAAMCGQSEG